MLNLENLKKKTLFVCTDISIKGITLCSKPVAKVMKHLVEINKLNHQSMINAAVDFDENKSGNNYLLELRTHINYSYESLKKRGFSFNKITRDKPKEIKKTEVLKVSE